MKKLLLTLTMLFLTVSTGWSLTYTTINDGDWNNKLDVWSTNGLTSCGCSPSYSLNGDTIVIQNYINLTGHLTLDGKSLVTISSGGSLVNQAMRLQIRDGKLISYGLLSVNELLIRVKGSAYFYSGVLNVLNRIEVAGIFEATFSNLYVQNGNIDVLFGGSFSIYGNTKIFFNTGNFNNWGSVYISNDSCIQLNGGNFKNNLGGTFAGNGTVITDVGNIINEGTWSETLNWCAAGSTFGLTTPENCELANEVCSFAPLAAELVNYNIVAGEMSNVIHWYTYAEEPGDWYALERSVDGHSWDQISQETSTGIGGEVIHYMVLDERPLKSISYYKLIQYNADGSEGFTAILAVNPLIKQELVVFPNPTSDRITIRFTQSQNNVSVKIVDGAGNNLDRYLLENTNEESFLIPYPCGLYFIYVEGENLFETIKVIKR